MGHTATCVWPLHLFARLKADSRIAIVIDHGSKGPCAERKARYCATSEEMLAGCWAMWGRKGEREGA